MPTRLPKALEEDKDAENSPKQLSNEANEEEDKGEQKKQCKNMRVPAFPEQPVPAAALPASLVPKVPEDVDGGDKKEGRHEGDDFVPDSQRANTLEAGTFELYAKPEVFENREDDKDEKEMKVVEEKGRDMRRLHSLSS